MSSEITILLPILFGLGCLYWSSLLGEEERLLALLLRFVFIPFTSLSLLLATNYARLDYISDSELVSNLANINLYSTYIFYITGIFYIFLILKGLYDIWVTKKEKHKEEMYG